MGIGVSGMRNIMLCGLLGCLALITCGKESGNPSGPDEGKYVLKGTVCNIITPLPNETIRVTGNGVNRTALTDINGAFSLSGLEAGAYTVRAEDKNYTFFPDSLEVTFPGSETRILEIVAFDPSLLASFMQFNGITICGRIATADGKPVANVRIKDTTTNQWGVLFYSYHY